MPASHGTELFAGGLGSVAESTSEAWLAAAGALCATFIALAMDAETFGLNSCIIRILLVFAPALALADTLTLNVALELRFSGANVEVDLTISFSGKSGTLESLLDSSTSR